jgi:hypothetical protein
MATKTDEAPARKPRRVGRTAPRASVPAVDLMTAIGPSAESMRAEAACFV